MYPSAPRTAAVKAHTASPTPVLPTPVLLDKEEEDEDGDEDEDDKGRETTRQVRWHDMSDKPNEKLPDIDRQILMAKWERDAFRMKLEELDRDMSVGFARWLFPDVGREA
jgi:hypothetical protein